MSNNVCFLKGFQWALAFFLQYLYNDNGELGHLKVLQIKAQFPCDTRAGSTVLASLKVAGGYHDVLQILPKASEAV